MNSKSQDNQPVAGTSGIAAARLREDSKCPEVDLQRKSKEASTQTWMHDDYDIFRGSISKDFGKLFESESNQDITINFEGRLIQAHKIILNARSGNFQNMIEAGSLVDLNVLDFTGYKEFIRFLYTDELEDWTFEKAMIFYVLGKKYAVKSLVCQSADYMKDNLSLECILTCMEIGERHSDEKLIDGVKKYLLDKKIYLRREFWLAKEVELAIQIANEVGKLSKDGEKENDVTKVDKCEQTMSYWGVDVSRESLSKDFGNLMKSGMHHDVEISHGGHLFKTHKIILTTRSKFFKRMLQFNMENPNGITEVLYPSAADPVYLEDYLWYLYTDELRDMSFDRAKALYEKGRRYEDEILAYRCSIYLQEFFFPEKVCECLVLAHAQSDKVLQYRVIAYILQKKIYLSDEKWFAFCKINPTLTKRINEVAENESLRENFVIATKSLKLGAFGFPKMYVYLLQGDKLLPSE